MKPPIYHIDANNAVESVNLNCASKRAISPTPFERLFLTGLRAVKARRIGVDGARALAAALHGNTSVTSIDLFCKEPGRRLYIRCLSALH